MAATKKALAAKAAREAGQQFVTVERFDSLEKSVGDLVELIKSGQLKTAAPAVAETPLEKEIRKAGPAQDPVPPQWAEKAQEHLGEALDHCEVTYLKGGGTVFTIVVRESHSNAPKEYLARYGADRRSKEVGTEGIAGVEEWCKLVAQNLKRNK